jgi:hypothetical protein
MKLSEAKLVLEELETVGFQLPNGELVPSHFHVTEVGKITKHFIDCGGTVRNEEVVNFQLWNANDYDHRLHPDKLLNIIKLSEKILTIEDLEIEVEYQTEITDSQKNQPAISSHTIGKYGLDFDGKNFLLTSKHTDCLAKANCGIPAEKTKVKLSDKTAEACCSPGGGCC